MSDDFQIQQGSSTTPYALTGAVVGGGAGWAGAHYLTKTKYGSYDDIIKEAKDSTDFSSKIEKAEGEEKKFLQAAKDLAGKEDAAGAEYDRLLQEYIDSHKDGVPQENEDFKKLVKDLEDKKKAAQTKAEEKLRASNTGELTDADKKLQDTLNNKIKGLEGTKAKYITDRQKAIDAFNLRLKEKPVKYTMNVIGASSGISAGARATRTFEGNTIEQLAHERANFDKTIESIREHLQEKIPTGKNDKNGKPILKNNPEYGKFQNFSEIDIPKVDKNGKIIKVGSVVQVERRIPADFEEVRRAVDYFNTQYQSKLNSVFGTIKDPELRKALMNDGVEAIQNARAVSDSVDARKAVIAKEHTKLTTAEATINNKAEIDKVVGDAAKKAAKDSKIAKDYAEYTTRDFNAEISPKQTQISTLEAKAKAGTITKTEKTQLATLKTQVTDLLRMQSSLESTIQGHYNTLMQNDLGAKAKELNTQKIYKDILRSEELINTNNGRTKNVWQRIGFAIGEWLGVPPKYLNAAENNELQEIGERLKQVKEDLKTANGGDATKAEQEFEKLVTDARKTTISNAEAEIKKLQTEYDAINKTITDRATAQKEIKRINKLVENIAGKGARFNAAGEIILADGKKFNPSVSFKLPIEVTAPASDSYITKLEKTIANIKKGMPNATKLTDEQIVQMAKEQVEKDLAADIKAVEDARTKLPKYEGITPEQAKAEFIKDKGERKDFIDKSVKDAQTTFKKDFKTWLERKWGFAEHTNVKIAGVAVAGAALIGGLAALLAPKNNG